MTNADRTVSVMNESSPPSGTLSSTLAWLLDELVAGVVGAQHAVVLSADGMLLAHSRGLARDDGDHLAAMASSLQSLARGVGRRFGGGAVQQNIVEMARGFLFVTAAGDGACLALLAEQTADMGLIGYEMNRLVQRLRQHLTAAPRNVRGTSAAAEGGARIHADG